MRHTTFLSKRFPEPVHRALCKAFHFQKVPVGESITSEGTPAGSLYFIASGRVSSFSRQSRRRTLVAAGMWQKAQQKMREANEEGGGSDGSPQSSGTVLPEPAANKRPGSGGGSNPLAAAVAAANTAPKTSRLTFADTVLQAARKEKPNLKLAQLLTSQEQASKPKPKAGGEAVGVIEAGGCIGEAELVKEGMNYMTTTVADEPVEVFEISREKYEAALQEGMGNDQKELKDFFRNHELLSGVAVSTVFELARIASRKTFLRGELCFASPPDPSLGPASIGTDEVAFVLSGEAHLLVGKDRPPVAPPSSTFGGEASVASTPRTPSSTSPRAKHQVGESFKVMHGPLSTGPHPGTGKVMVHLGAASASERLSAVTICNGEYIHEGLFAVAGGGNHGTNVTSWCLCPVSSHLEVLVLPRERWRAALGLSRGALQRCEQLVAEKAEFFRERVLMAQRALHANMPAEPEVTSLLRKPELPSRLRKKRWMSKPKQADPAPLPKGGWAPHLDHSWDPSDPFASAPKAPTRLTKDPFAEFKKMDAAAAAAPKRPLSARPNVKRISTTFDPPIAASSALPSPRGTSLLRSG